MHVRAFEALGGVPQVLVPDNLKAAVTARPRGRLPVLNPAYAALADHYGTVIEPARPNHPKDKPLAELSVKLVHRALTAILRRRSFFSLRELNEAVKEVVEKLNSRRFTLVPAQSRASLFELIDRPALLPLPETSFQYEAMQVGLPVVYGQGAHRLRRRVAETLSKCTEIEETVRGRVKMARDRSKMGMLLSTIALEHFTAMMAEMHARHRDLFDETPAGVEQLWRWHAMEETEHKAVAYDVFLEVTKDWSPWKRYLIRCRTMALVTLMFTRNISRYAARLLEADGYTPEAALKAVKRFVWGNPGIFRRGWKTYLAWYRPGFHPWDQDDREQFADWKAEFDAAVA